MLDGGELLLVFDAGGVVGVAESAAGVVALFLEGTDLAIEAAKDVDHLGKSAEVSFDLVGAGSLLEEDLGEAGGTCDAGLWRAKVWRQ